jgi:hypothetical protein
MKKRNQSASKWQNEDLRTGISNSKATFYLCNTVLGQSLNTTLKNKYESYIMG